jgi:hypothetical protein
VRHGGKLKGQTAAGERKNFNGKFSSFGVLAMKQQKPQSFLCYAHSADKS